MHITGGVHQSVEGLGQVLPGLLKFAMYVPALLSMGKNRSVTEKPIHDFSPYSMVKKAKDSFKKA